MKFYGPKEVCSKLQIGDSTLRKWAGYLIKNGEYQFVIDQYGHRSYSDRDIAVLQRLQSLLAQKYTYMDAVKEICSPENANNAENANNPDGSSVLARTDVPSVPYVLGDEMYVQLMNALQEQANINRQLIERLERIEEREQEREERIKQRDQALVQVLRQLQETAAKRTQKKKSSWPWKKH